MVVSPAADLDRERVDEMVILLKVTDSGGNSDSVVVVFQEFVKIKSYMQKTQKIMRQ